MRRLLIATFLLLLVLPSAAALAADRPQDLLIDACRDEKVDGTYSQRTYKKALDQLPADSDQYTACRDVINRARLAALNARSSHGGGGSSGGGGAGAGGRTGGGGGATGAGTGAGASTRSSGAARGGQTASAPPSPTEQRAVAQAITSGAQPVRVGDRLVRPGAVGRLSSDNRQLPSTVLALLIALALCSIAGAGAIGWNRVLPRRLR